MRIEGCKALVTGANRGIGLAFVEALLEAEAARVYLGARKPGDAEAVRAANPDRVELVELDITRPDQVESAAARCGGVELLVNNAGVFHNQTLMGAPTMDALREEIEVNYLGTLRMCRAFAPVIEAAGGGCIVNVLSAGGIVAVPDMGGYSPSKFAMRAASDCIRAELAPRGIHVSALIVGSVDTRMADHVTGVVKARAQRNRPGWTHGGEVLDPGARYGSLRHRRARRARAGSRWPQGEPRAERGQARSLGLVGPRAPEGQLAVPGFRASGSRSADIAWSRWVAILVRSSERGTSMTTILSESTQTEVEAQPGDGLWLSRADTTRATGWSMKAEGFCRDEVCVPLPRGREAEFVRDDAVNVAGLWAHMGRPVAASDDGGVWALGEGAAGSKRGARLARGARLHASRFRGPADLASRLPGQAGPADHLGQLVRLPP